MAKEEISSVSAWEITLRTVGGALKVMERDMQDESDLPMTWYDVIINLYFVPGRRLRMQALGDALILTRSGVTRLVDRVEAAGLVRREAAVEDRRGYYAILTEEGAQTVERVQPIHMKSIERNVTQYLDAEECSALYRIMNKIWNGNPLLAGSADAD